MTGHPSTSRAEQLANFRAGLLNFLLAGVGVDVQGGGNVGVAADALNRLEVDVRLRQGRDVAVPENMRRRPIKVDFAADALVQPAEHHVGQRRLPTQHIPLSSKNILKTGGGPILSSPQYRHWHITTNIV